MKTLSTRELNEMRASKKQDLTLVNVLPEESFRREHIPGSINVPLRTPELAATIAKAAGGKSDPVVVYCASAECDASPKAAKALEEAGFRDVRDYEVGVKGWKEAGLPLQGSEAGTSAR